MRTGEEYHLTQNPAGYLNPQVSRDQIDPLARQLNMRGGNVPNIVEFLRALEDPSFDRTISPRVPAGWPSAGG